MVSVTFLFCKICLQILSYVLLHKDFVKHEYFFFPNYIRTIYESCEFFLVLLLFQVRTFLVKFSLGENIPNILFFGNAANLTNIHKLDK